MACALSCPMTNLADEYERQARWRHWQAPVKAGERVFDLGCGVGHMTAQLQAFGADVIGVDLNDELLARARSRHPGLRFEKLDLCELQPDSFGMADGIWSSFTPAYFPDLESTLKKWCACLRPGGWLALVEVDDLFGHEPLDPRFLASLRAFYQDARGRYDFECGRRLRSIVEAIGLHDARETVLADDEFSFEGPAPPDVYRAWRERLARMAGLQRFFGADFAELEGALLAALADPAHRSKARVIMVVARKPR